MTHYVTLTHDPDKEAVFIGVQGLMKLRNMLRSWYKDKALSDLYMYVDLCTNTTCSHEW